MRTFHLPLFEFLEEYYKREHFKLLEDYRVLDIDLQQALKLLLEPARHAYSEANTHKGRIGMAKCDRELEKLITV